MSDYHIPVLLNESIEGLNIRPGGIYVDATYGGGGHSEAILKQLKTGELYAFDQDEDARRNLPHQKKFFFIQGNFRFLGNYLKYYGVSRIDGLIADLGVSSHQFDEYGRGFTYRSNAELDMRMNRKAKLTAELVINSYEAAELSALFRNYAELEQPHKLASAIVGEREKNRIVSVNQLIGCIEHLVPKHAFNKYISRVFQALRIEVNRELDNLRDMLNSAGTLLNNNGRLVVISYHSLEDRIVKNFMRWGNPDKEPESDLYGHRPVPFRIITRKPVTACEAEVNANPRARSAKLRIAEKQL